MFSAEFPVPRAGQYTFTIRLDKPVDNDRLHIQIARIDGAGGGEGNGPAPIPDNPPQPAAGWRFVYYMRFTGGFQRVDFVGWGSQMRIYRYHTNSESAIWETYYDVVPDGANAYKAKCLQNANLTQGFSHDEGWRHVWLGQPKYTLERKIQA